MKGIQLTTMTVILIILGIIVLLIWGIFLGTAKAGIDIENAKDELRKCCLDRGIWDCADATKLTSFCKTNFGIKTISDLQTMVSLSDTQLRNFCNCV